MLSETHVRDWSPFNPINFSAFLISILVSNFKHFNVKKGFGLVNSSGFDRIGLSFLLEK
jgi:hypothetical protein